MHKNLNKTISAIEEFLNTKYKEFAYYTLNSRAIPSLKDGLKIVQRRSMWIAKDNAKKFTKVATLAGIAMRIHPHGNVSLEDAISKMAQDFTRANNYPLLTGDGAFGNKLSGPGEGIGASRYVGVKINDTANKLLYVDMDLIKVIPNYDGEFEECEHFLPIVPIAILNGVEGIAVGYATEIQSHKIEDVIKIQKKVIRGEKLTNKDIILPWYVGYNGKIFVDEEGVVKSRGLYKLNGKKELNITELAIGWTDEHYHVELNNLVEKGIIKDFENESKDDFDYRIKLPNNFDTSEENIIKVFKLESNLNQNINFINTNDKLRTYNNVTEAIEEFTNWRFTFYKNRYELWTKNLKDTTSYNKELLKFIRFVLDNNYLTKMSKMTKANMMKELEGKFNYIDKLLSIPVSYFNMEKIQELKERVLVDDKQIAEWEKIIASDKLRRDIYVSELDAIKV